MGTRRRITRGAGTVTEIDTEKLSSAKCAVALACVLPVIFGNVYAGSLEQDNDVSPSIGVVYAVTDHHALYVSIATAFETPTSTEFANPDGSGGFNPNLEPQKSTSYELGLRGALSENSRYEFAAFTVDVDDELIPFEIASSPGRDFFANAGKSNRRGLELAVSAEPVPGLSLSLAYTWSQFEFDTFTDNDRIVATRRVLSPTQICNIMAP